MLHRARRDLGNIVFNRFVVPPNKVGKKMRPPSGDYGHLAHFDELFCGDGSDLLHPLRLAGPGRFALDLGGGTGRLALALAERGVNVVLTDLSDDMLQLARIKRARLPVATANRLTILRQDMGDLKFSDPFDFVFCLCNSVAHLDSKARIVECLRRVYSHLRPGGVFIVDVHHYECWEKGAHWKSGAWHYIADVRVPSGRKRLWQRTSELAQSDRVLLEHAVSAQFARYELTSTPVYFLPTSEWHALLVGAGFEVAARWAPGTETAPGLHDAYVRYVALRR